MAFKLKPPFEINSSPVYERELDSGPSLLTRSKPGNTLPDNWGSMSICQKYKYKNLVPICVPIVLTKVIYLDTRTRLRVDVILVFEHVRMFLSFYIGND